MLQQPIAFQTGNSFRFEYDDEIYVFLYIKYNKKGECMLFYTKEDNPFSRKINGLFDLVRV